MEKKVRLTHVFVLSLLLLSSSSQAFCGYSFCLDGDTPPQWRDQMQSASRIPKGDSVVLQAEAMDIESLRWAVLSTNETGTWSNLTESSFLWKQEAVNGYDNFGTATYENGVIFAPSKGDHVSDGMVYALNALNGNIIWNASIRQCDASPCIDGDIIYVGECFSVVPDESILNPKAIALNKTNGEEIWHCTEPNGCGWVGSPVIHDDCVYYTTGSYDYTTHLSSGSGVYALNKTSGERIWQTDIGFFVCSAAYHEGVVFVSGSDYVNPQGQFALNATTGEIIWHVNWGPSWDSSPVIDEGKIIQVAIDRALYPTQRSTFVLNETDGRYIRKFRGKGTPSTPLVHNGKIFIPDDDWKMWAFDLETGDEIWRTVELHDGALSNHSYCSPVASGGAIYYQSFNGTFYVIDEANGKILWSYDLGGLGIGSPSIGDGGVFITNDSGLYAFRIGPGSGNWPMFCQNHLHRSTSDQGIEYLRWPLTQPQNLAASNTWVTAEFVWRNKTIASAAIAWRIYFIDETGNTNATNMQIFSIFTTDLNADDKVNIQDITIVAVSFGSVPGDPKWNVMADLDHDGMVNILDISLVAKDYGKTA